MKVQLQGLTIVIPALNEAATIGQVVAEALTAAERVMVVDDGSTDGTGEAARMAGAIVLRHDRPGGYDVAISHGLNEAFLHGTTAAITMDADGQHRIEDLRSVASAVLSGNLLFCGGIRNKYNRPVEWLIGLLSQPIFGTRDPFCGLKCYHQSFYEICGPFPAQMNIQTTPLVWVKRFELPNGFLNITAHARIDKPRFGSTLRASLNLGLAFLRTLNMYLRS